MALDRTSNRDDLLAAARAAASWAHARRATWTDTPLSAAQVAARVAAPPAPIAAPPPVIVAAPPPRSILAVSTPAAIAEPPVAREPARKPVGDRIGAVSKSALSVAAPAARWVALAAVVAGAGVAVYIEGPRLWKSLPAIPLPSTSSAPPAKPSREVAAPRTGGLQVTSTPDGARVLVDGKVRGFTPLTLAEIVPGRHDISIESSAGTVRRTVTVTAGQTAAVDESIFSGWVVVYAPFEVVVSENGRVLQPDERSQLMLAPGTHRLRITNRRLSYDSAQTVEIKPGETTTVQLSPEPTMLTVTASEAAEVWVDGARFGDTPLQSAPIPLGTHQIVVKSAAGGEKQFTVTAGVKPVTLDVDFKQ